MNVADSEKRTPLHILCSNKALVFPFPLPHLSCASSLTSSETSQSLPNVHHVTRPNSYSCYELRHCSSSNVTRPVVDRARQSDDEADASGATRRKWPSTDKSSSSHTQLLKLLVKAGCNVNAQDRHRNTALHILAANGNVDGL